MAQQLERGRASEASRKTGDRSPGQQDEDAAAKLQSQEDGDAVPNGRLKAQVWKTSLLSLASQRETLWLCTLILLCLCNFSFSSCQQFVLSSRWAL